MLGEIVVVVCCCVGDGADEAGGVDVEVGMGGGEHGVGSADDGADEFGGHGGGGVGGVGWVYEWYWSFWGCCAWERGLACATRDG